MLIVSCVSDGAEMRCALFPSLSVFRTKMGREKENVEFDKKSILSCSHYQSNIYDPVCFHLSIFSSALFGIQPVFGRMEYKRRPR